MPLSVCTAHGDFCCPSITWYLVVLIENHIVLHAENILMTRAECFLSSYRLRRNNNCSESTALYSRDCLGINGTHKMRNLNIQGKILILRDSEHI